MKIRIEMTYSFCIEANTINSDIDSEAFQQEIDSLVDSAIPPSFEAIEWTGTTVTDEAGETVAEY